MITASLEQGMEDEAQFQTELISEKQVETERQRSGGQFFLEYDCELDDQVFNNTQLSESWIV